MKRTILALASTLFIFSITACGKAFDQSLEPADIAGDPSVEIEPLLNTPLPSTFARFAPERKDDFAWENDMVAFRAYGPALRDSVKNAGVDCWLKKVNYPIINKWYKQHLEQDTSYHVDHGEGLDNYHVGASAGCGVTTHDGKAQVVCSKENGWLMTWEILDEYGLGTAVMVEAGAVESVEILDNSERKDYNHAVLIVNTDKNGKVSYASGYGWEGAGEISSPELWQTYLENSTVLR